MEIKLLSMSLKNFKGINDFAFSPEGKSVSVFGDNETGKTSLNDGFLWPLFNKDSLGRSDFEVKTLGGDGEAIHNLDHGAEIRLEIDGKPVMLRKVFKEKYTKKRGQTRKEFTGHTTKHYVDDVPVKEKEYKEKVNELVDEGLFRLLTDPRYFNSLNWKDQRDILLTVCGDVSDSEVMASDKALAEVRFILNGHSIDDQKKIINERRKKINEELKEIPARIDELTKSLPEAADLSTLQHDLAEVQQSITLLNDKRQNALNSDGQAQINADLATARNELQVIKTDHDTIIREKSAGLDRILTDKKNALYDADRQKIEAEQSKTAAETKLNRLGDDILKNRATRTEEDAQVFEYDDDTVCPTCGQQIPEDQIQDARQTAEESFNKNKAAILARFDKEAQSMTEDAARFEQMIDKFADNAQAAIETAAAINAEIADLESQIKGIKETPLPDAYAAKEQEIKDLGAKLESQEAPDTSEIDKQIEEKKARESELNAAVAAESQRAKSDDRIHELEDQEAKLAAEYEDLEGQLNLLDKFIVAKVGMLEAKINSRFEITKFKLFDAQINGGVNEICVATHNGVPYGSMNNAARINVGLDIINVLSDHHGITAPIWIDNAEAVTRYIDTRAQVIRLNVSEAHKELSVLVENKESAAA